MLAEPADGPEAVFRDAAIMGRGWLDPDPQRTELTFKGMIDDATSGASRLAEAIQRAERDLTNLIGL